MQRWLSLPRQSQVHSDRRDYRRSRSKDSNEKRRFSHLCLEETAIDAIRPCDEFGVASILDDADASNTRMRSRLCTVESRCAITIVVRPADKCAMASRMRASDTEFEAGGCLIEDKNRGRGKDRAGNRHPLPLAARKFDATLADRCAIGFGQPVDEDIRMRQASGFLDCTGRHLWTSIGDIFRQRAMKQNRLLRDEADCLAQAHLRDLGDILPVDQNPAAVAVVKPLQQLDEGRLAGAGRPDRPTLSPGRISSEKRS